VLINRSILCMVFVLLTITSIVNAIVQYQYTVAINNTTLFDTFNYNNVDWRLFILSYNNTSPDDVYMNCYIYKLYNAKTREEYWNKDPDLLYARLLSKLNNFGIQPVLIHEPESRIQYTSLVNEIKVLFEDLGIDIQQVNIGLDLVIVHVFRSQFDSQINEDIVDRIFDHYIKYNELRRELAYTRLRYLYKNTCDDTCKEKVNIIMNMSINDIKERFKVIIIEKIVTKEEYTMYFNETLNRLISLVREGKMPEWVIGGGGESVLGAVEIDLRYDKLEEYGLDERKAITYLRQLIGNDYPLQIRIFSNVSSMELWTNRKSSETYPIWQLYIAFIVIAVLAIFLKRSRLFRK